MTKKQVCFNNLVLSTLTRWTLLGVSAEKCSFQPRKEGPRIIIVHAMPNMYPAFQHTWNTVYLIFSPPTKNEWKKKAENFSTLLNFNCPYAFQKHKTHKK